MKLITAGKRPASVYHKGGEVHVHIHDAWYQTRCEKWTVIIRRTHTDRLRNRFGNVLKGKTCRRAIDALRTFQKLQRSWYTRLGLEAPKVRYRA